MSTNPLPSPFLPLYPSTLLLTSTFFFLFLLSADMLFYLLLFISRLLVWISTAHKHDIGKMKNWGVCPHLLIP